MVDLRILFAKHKLRFNGKKQFEYATKGRYGRFSSNSKKRLVLFQIGDSVAHHSLTEEGCGSTISNLFGKKD